MNTIKTTGFYYGYNMTNSATTNISSFIVAKYSPDWGSQIQLCSSSGKAYIRYWRDAGGIMGEWKTLAYTSDIPTSLPWNSITSKPSFATVATTGSYNDLTNKPTIDTHTAITNTEIDTIFTNAGF